MSNIKPQYRPYNPIKPDLESEFKYSRTLSYLDIFSAGYGFIVGAGIFTLLPFILKYSGGFSWLVFIIGGIICILTGLSYSKLNSFYPTNDAEYAWILNILNFDKDRDPTKIHPYIKYFANTIIWIIFFIGILSGATIVVSQAYFVKDYIDFNKPAMIAILLAIPTFINIIGTKYTTKFNKSIMVIITTLFVMVYGVAISKGSIKGKLELVPQSKNVNGIFTASFITIFIYNGYQSIVQLSEEAKQESDIPKGIMGTLCFAIVIYILFAISVIALIGVKGGSQSKMPMVDALGMAFNSKATNIIYIINIIALTNTILIITLSRSRLLQKLSVRNLAPSIFKKLDSFQNLIKKESFDTGNTSTETEITTPINSIIGVSLITFLFTFIKQGSIEYLAQLTNIFLFFIFIIVNALVIVFYYKPKNKDEEERERVINTNITYLGGYPWYAVLGLIITLAYLVNIDKLKFPK
jgi:APA family basic amino acid/polyamine antiporter